METNLWIIGIVGGSTAILLLYWLFVLTEGTYLGQPVVTFLYDITASKYDSIKGFDIEMEATYLGRPIADALCQIPSPLLLDIATGTGRLPLTLFEQPTFQGRIIGVDHSFSMIRLAARKLQPYGSHRLALLWLDAMELPFPDKVFDAVTALEMIEFTPNPSHLLAEAVRVLRPGGLFVVTRRRGLDARLMPAKTFTEQQMVDLVSALGIEHLSVTIWQVDYDLVCGVRAGSAALGPRTFLEVLYCPKCHQLGLNQAASRLRCRNCGAEYWTEEGVINMNGEARCRRRRET